MSRMWVDLAEGCCVIINFMFCKGVAPLSLEEPVFLPRLLLMQDAYKSLRPSQLALPLSLSVVSRALSIKSLDNSQLLFWLHARRVASLPDSSLEEANVVWQVNILPYFCAENLTFIRYAFVHQWYCKWWWSDVWFMIKEAKCKVWRTAKCCNRTLAVSGCAYFDV